MLSNSYHKNKNILLSFDTIFVFIQSFVVAQNAKDSNKGMKN